MVVTIISAPMIARGSARCGSLTSSPAVATASSPMKEKNIVPAAALTPTAPAAKKPEKWSASNAVKPIMQKSTSTPSLIRTMIELSRADSEAPRSSSSMQRKTRTTAGRLMRPPVGSPSLPGMGETDKACGSCHPKTSWRSSLK